jgi:putative PIN family toxin of toxin-antitoxin system
MGSAFLTPRGHSAALKFLWQANRFDVVVSVQLLAELADVLARPRLQNRYQYTTDEIATYPQLVAELAHLVTITGMLNLCRDPDDILLETSIVGNATHVVSRDEDVTRDREIVKHLKNRKIQVVTVQKFLDELK